ncbi:glycogen/starch synthase [Criblamydia sequanensis]|uniref:starch synthase n=1 Tax=Candidatus Criblamydia sequanensis CRIB-18 TaxID=1437425 RepID=A0A090CY74_9BACT|nr:glycogen/starch synthase [Criblamydia sequanensis]CDR33362.1 Glycogen synthase/1,4-alpha-glucan-branching enzyme [Criblamydia sequanensis CRIB-18]
MNIENNSKISSIFHVNERTEELQRSITNVSAANPEITLEILKKTQLSLFEKLILKIVNFVRSLFGLKSKAINRLLQTQTIAAKCIRFCGTSKANPPLNQELPIIITAGKLNLFATKCQFKIAKAQDHTEILQQIQEVSKNEEVFSESQISNKKVFNKLKNILNNIVEIYSNKQPEKLNKKIETFDDLIKKAFCMTDENNQNVVQQLNKLYLKKKEGYSALVNLHVIKQKLKKDFTPKKLQELLQDHFEEFSKFENDASRLDPSKALEYLSQKIQKKKAYIQKIDKVLDDFSNKVHDDFSVYKVSAKRLIEEIPSEILDKPINVTMIGVEFTGLIKEGGLAEALEGMAKAMKNQHPDNKVRLIFPKFNILPAEIQKAINQVQPSSHLNSKDKPYKVYTIELGGIEYNFIEDPSFILSGQRPSIYGPDEASSKERFAVFSGLAADFVKELKTDVIHLHDWHVAGVALKLHNDSPEKRDYPPIVFTYHNNSRMAQGRFEQGIYNYEPVIQGLIQAGIASENVNFFVEAIKKSDAITTVSESFGIESQDMSRGEGVSFAAREAAQAGKLTGIINGSNPHSWNPEEDALLKNWKDPETGIPFDLTYGPNEDDLTLIEKKELCKTHLQKWAAQNFPHAKVDFTKPIVTYVGRFDSYQKGLDKLEGAIEETLKNGGQFIVMGSLEDKKASKILDDLEIKYKENVLFIRDFKDPNGRYHYQQGDKDRQGCGSLVRGASDFLLIPSKFEPCGLVQFEGWLFGSLSIGSKVGGLSDTIIPPEKNSERFNGFLFNREEKNSMETAIRTALLTWKNYTPEQKGRLVRRIIEEGRKYSWSTSPSGYSPIEKYRFVYENAKKFAIQRKNPLKRPLVNICSQMDKIRDTSLIQHHRASNSDKLEENYSAYFYNQFNFKKLEKMYRALPEKVRGRVSSPYGYKVNSKTYEKLGSHFISGADGANIEGVQFAVEAPQAKTVQVKILTENQSHLYELSKEKNGTWAGFVPGLGIGTYYQFIVNGQIKLDPLGLSHLQNPIPGEPLCSVVVDRAYEWNDQEWMQSRVENAGKPAPVSVYEVHPLTWKKKNGEFLNYREFALELVKHCKTMGYTHVELMGILEHPNEISWGYQVTGFFSPTSRMGTPEDFKYLVETLHNHQIGVYLDWIPAHFAKDPNALSYFDGSNQYQPSFLALLFSIRNLAFDWGTYFFDYGKKPIRNFLTSSAIYWLKEMHIDGLRVDAVRCMLLSEDSNSSRRFLKDLNTVVHRDFPGVMMMAEDYSGEMETTKSMASGGLGFDQKWNIGWMKNSLEYFSKPPTERKGYYHKITTAVSEDTFHKMILAISHDEVTIKLNALLEKNTNLSVEEKFANLRAFFGYIMSAPGKKLMFMGCDSGLSQGWDEFIGKEKGLMDLKLGEKESNSQKTLQRLNRIYKSYTPFWQHDDNANDLTWIEKNDPQKIIHAYRRTSNEGESIACFHNFSSEHVEEFKVFFENKEILEKMKILALKGKKNKRDNANKDLSSEEIEKLSCLSRYPNFFEKIKNDANLKKEFFKWVFQSKKSIEEFLKKHGLPNLQWHPHEIFNSDETEFGGKGRTNKKLEYLKDGSGTIIGYKLQVPPLSNVFISENASPLPT